MRNMSFALTTEQMRNRSKNVTRRIGWRKLKAGDRVQAVVKGQGIPKGGKVERICEIEIVSNSAESLDCILLYPQSEVAREGFPNMTQAQFVEMFCKHNQCVPHIPIQRIEFKYV